MLDVIRGAIRLDVVDLLPAFSDPGLVTQRIVSPQNWRQRLLFRSRLVGILMFFRRMMATWLPAGMLPDPSDTILLASFSLNQSRALAPLHERLQNESARTCFFDGWQRGGSLRRLSRHSFLFALPFIPVLIYRMVLSRGFAWKSFAWGLDGYWHAYGAYVATRRWFQKHRPRTVVVSNDHNFWPRVLVAAAQAEGIPTVYIQHAPVTERFPRLTMDYALLEGRKSLKLYSDIGESRTRVFLIGMPRMDPYIGNLNRRTAAATVGICIGNLDSMEQAESLIRHVVSCCGELAFLVRPHPATPQPRLDYWKRLCVELNLAYSDSRSEHPFEFLSRVDVVIAGGSGIILEALLMNVTPIMHALNPNRPDWYGFGQEGLCPLFFDSAEVAELLYQLQKYRPDVRSLAKSYCATIDTEYDGRATELAADVVYKISRCDASLMAKWQRIDDAGPLAAYEVTYGKELAQSQTALMH